MKYIQMDHGRVAVDDADFEWLSQYRWKRWRTRMKNGKLQQYARRQPTVWRKRRGRMKRVKITVVMHREILGLKCGVGFTMGRSIEGDHKDGNGLNNTRANLRRATRSQNLANCGPKVKGAKYKGISFHRIMHLWRAQIGACTHIGYFKTAKEAALAYDEAAIERFGEFARLNFGGENPIVGPLPRGVRRKAA